MLKSILFMLLICAEFHLLSNYSLIKQEIISFEDEDSDCHGSSLIEIEPGILLAVWKAGAGKGLVNYDIRHNISIWCSRCVNGVWSNPEKIAQSDDSLFWTPTLIKMPSGEIDLFYRLGSYPWQCVGIVKRSFDNGTTWSEEEVLPAGILGPIRSKPQMDQEGRLIFGSSLESGSSEEPFKAAACWIDALSRDGNNWTKYGPIAIPGQPFGVIEPVLFRDREGNLRLFCRDRSKKLGQHGWIRTATSYDHGRTWSELKKTDLPNPDSGMEIVELGKGGLLLFYNHSHEHRFPLDLALSTDGGDSWTSVMTLETDSGEFPSAIQASDGTIHVIYTWKQSGKTQRVIKYSVLSIQTQHATQFASWFE